MVRLLQTFTGNLFFKPPLTGKLVSFTQRKLVQCCKLSAKLVKPVGHSYLKSWPRRFIDINRFSPVASTNTVIAANPRIYTWKQERDFILSASHSEVTDNHTFVWNGPSLNRIPEKLSPAMNLSNNKTFQELLTPELQKLVNAFLENGHGVRIVGGAVRDIILSRHLPKDIDLATTATPDEMMNVFKSYQIRYIETGLQHGTLTAHLNGHDFEITTLRIDTEHDGRRATVEFTNDWKLDAERRDLTFNAMSLDFDGNLYDYFSGCDDLASKKVRFVGNPEKRIKEDFLRILRYFRFHGRISDDANDHDPKTLEIIKNCAYGLKNVAQERVWAEVSRILPANHAPSLLKYMYDLGVAENIGLPPCTDKHLKDFESVWNHGHTHLLEPVTLLMSLVDTADEADSLAFSLKLSSAERNLGKFIVNHRNILHPEDPKKPYQDILASHCNAKLIDKIKKHVDQLLRYKGLHDMACEISDWPIPLFPVNGNDLKKVGIKPGPLLGKVLHDMKGLWMESYYTLNREELLEKTHHITANIHL